MKIATSVAVLLAAVPAWADEVVLRNGGRFEGRVVEAPGSVTVYMDFGSISFPRSEVALIRSGASVIQEFARREAELRAGDAEARYRLALWAKQHDLTNGMRRLLNETLALDPQHEGARTELGYRRHEGRWLTEEEYRAARGEVLFRGAWIKKTEAEAIEQREADRAASVYLETELLKARTMLLAAEADYARAKAEAERVRADIEREKRLAQERLAAVAYVPVYHVHVVNGKNVPCACKPKACK